MGEPGIDSELERILRPDYLSDLTDRSLAEVRAMRDECQAVETELSYLRRLAQGRVDIVAAEQARRGDGAGPAPVSALVESLPEVLSDRIRGPGPGRLPRLLAPGERLPRLAAELEAIVGAHDIEDLPGLDDGQLGALADALAIFEHRVSALRRDLFERVDATQAEITRRYQTGEATVDTLLH